MVARPFNNPNALLSEGAAFAVVVGDFHEMPHQTRDNTDFPRPLRESGARLRLACPPGGKAIERCRGQGRSTDRS